ncbi:MAG: DUF58 domain-containing protein [Acidimicrobiia bacterium]|nr:DUF58 domain-containing protein [Acidimicrobiia bacterium]
MTRRSTERLPVALALSLIGGVAAVALGRPAIAMLVTPWFVLLVAGIIRAGRQAPSLTVTVDEMRPLVGDTIEITATVANTNGRVTMTASPWSPVGALSRRPVAPREIVTGGGAAQTVTFPVPTDQWGTFDVGRIGIEVVEPYGLTRWTGVLHDPTPIRVHPTSQQIQSMVAPWFVRRTTGAHRSRATGRGVEYADLRPYGPGDSLRDINWRVSARSDRLWTSQRHPDRATDVILLLDSFVESGHDVQTMFGLAIEAAVALAESHLSVIDRVGLVEFGGLVRWVVPGTGRLQLQRLVDALLATALYANAADRDLALIGPRAIPPRSFVLALSPLLDDRFIEALVELTGRGHDVAVIECDPAIDRTATARTDDGGSTTGGAQAAEPTAADVAWRIWSAERMMLRDRLAQRGVAVSRWERDLPLEVTLRELTRKRRRIGPLVRR